jgi:PleD family two-component response regulator
MRTSIQKLKIKRISTCVSIGTITASFGITHYCPDESPEHIIERSIKALKQAKQQGRNNIVTL